MTRRALLLASAAVPTHLPRVLEPKDFPNPYWRGIMFGWDSCRELEFDGLIATPVRRTRVHAPVTDTASRHDAHPFNAVGRWTRGYGDGL